MFLVGEGVGGERGGGGLVFVLGFGFGVFVCVFWVVGVGFLAGVGEGWGEGTGGERKKWCIVQSRKKTGLTQRKSS